VAADFFKGLEEWEVLRKPPPGEGVVVYGGPEDQDRRKARILGWRSIGRLVEFADRFRDGPAPN
jgi:hypothetical protein